MKGPACLPLLCPFLSCTPYSHLDAHSPPLQGAQRVKPTPPLMGCNSSALTEAGMLFQGLLPHTHLPTGSFFHNLFPAPSGLHSRFQIPCEMALYQGKGWVQGRGAGLWLAHRARTTSPREGREEKKARKEHSSSCNISRKSPVMLEPRGDPPPQQTLLQEQTQQSTRCIQQLKCCLC